MSELELQTNRIYQGHVLDVLKTFPDNYFSLIMCSPPYWGLRDYEGPSIIWDGLEDCEHEWGNEVSKGGRIKRLEDMDPKQSKIDNNQFIDKPSNFCIKCDAWKGQLGLEPDFNMFIDHLMQIFEECKRILRKDGAIWVNLGDTYYGGGNASGHTEESKNFGLSTLKRGMVNNPVARGNQLKNKTLVGIPDRFKIAMIDNGWICRNEVIWHKPNCMPSSVKDRFTVDFEKFFFFTKNKNYYFEQQFEPMDLESLNPNNPKGHNRQNLGKWQDKYKDVYQEAKHRQGMNKDRGNGLVRKRNLPDQKEFVDYLRKYDKNDKDFIYSLTTKERIEDVSDALIIPKSTVEHWFRYDDTGFAYPSIEDWVKFQDFYDIDKFPELVEYWEEPDTIDNNLLGRNKRAVWSINTKPFPGAHFAVFPEELILPIIKSCVPKQICTKCDKPRTEIIEKGASYYEKVKDTEKPKFNDDRRDNYKISGEDYKKHKLENPDVSLGLSDCGCDSKFNSGVVLDCFMGAGTTGVVAKKEKVKWVGIELNPEYIEMATERIRNTPVYHELSEFF